MKLDGSDDVCKSSAADIELSKVVSSQLKDVSWAPQTAFGHSKHISRRSALRIMRKKTRVK